MGINERGTAAGPDDLPERTGPTRTSRRRLLTGAAGAATAVTAANLSRVNSASAAPAASDVGLASYYDVKGYGARGDGVTDDTAAIQAAVDDARSNGGGVVYLPTGSYPVSRSINITSGSIGVRGVGMSSEIIGTAPTGNIIFAGRPTEGAPPVQNVFFEDFAIRASVKKTSGAAIFGQYAERFRIEDVRAARHESAVAANNLYDSFYFRYYDTVALTNVNIAASHAGLTLFGRPDQSYGAGLWLHGGSRVLLCEVGVHIAGSSGGIAFEDVDIIGNDTNVLIDASGSGVANRELFFDSCWLDSAGYTGMEIMPGAVNILHLNGTWVASSGLATQGHPDGANIRVHRGSVVNPVTVLATGCRIFNALGSGIVTESGSWNIVGCSVEVNGRGDHGGYGIVFDDASVSDVLVSGCTIRYNGESPQGSTRPTAGGIRIDPHVRGCLVTSNIVKSNGHVQIDAPGHHQRDRIIRDNLT